MGVHPVAYVQTNNGFEGTAAMRVREGDGLFTRVSRHFAEMCPSHAIVVER